MTSADGNNNVIAKQADRQAERGIPLKEEGARYCRGRFASGDRPGYPLSLRI